MKTEFRDPLFFCKLEWRRKIPEKIVNNKWSKTKSNQVKAAYQPGQDSIILKEFIQSLHI